MKSKLISHKYKKDISKFISYAKNYYCLPYSERYKLFNQINEETISVRRNILNNFILENISTTPSQQLQNILIGFSGEVLNFVPFSNRALIYFISKDEMNKFSFNDNNPISMVSIAHPSREDNNFLSGLTLENCFFIDKYKHLAGSIILINNNIDNKNTHITKEHELNHAFYYFHPNRLHQQILIDKINNQNISSSEKEQAIIEFYKFSILFELSGILYSLRIYDYQSAYDAEFIEIIKPLSLKILNLISKVSNKGVEKNIINFGYKNLHEFNIIKNKIYRAIKNISLLIDIPDNLAHAFLFVSRAMQILTYEEMKKDLTDFCLEYIYPSFKRKK